MTTLVNIPLPQGNNWKEWAGQLVEYLYALNQLTSEVDPKTIHLTHLVGNEKAIEEGAVMYDPAKTSVVVSKNNEWRYVDTHLIGWGSFSGTTGGIQSAEGLTCTRTGVGLFTINFNTTQANTNYCVTVTPIAGAMRHAIITSRAVGSFNVRVEDNSGTLTDPVSLCVMAHAI